LLPAALTPRSQENFFEHSKPGDSADNGSDKNKKDKPVYVERNITFSENIKILKNRLLSDPKIRLRLGNSSNSPFTNTVQWIAHAKTVWYNVQVTIKHFEDITG